MAWREGRSASRRPYPRCVARPTKKRGDDNPQGPSLRLLLLPFVVFGAAALAAGLHKVLGEPLGPSAAAKLSDTAQTLAMMLVVYGPMMGYVQRQNALAQSHEERRQLPTPVHPREEADDEHSHPRQRRVPGPRDPR